eukprot:350197-Chlamydomonas_euryale.AAC.5
MIERPQSLRRTFGPVGSVCVMSQLWTAQPPPAEWIRRGQSAHTPPQRPPGAEGKGRHKGRKRDRQVPLVCCAACPHPTLGDHLWGGARLAKASCPPPIEYSYSRISESDSKSADETCVLARDQLRPPCGCRRRLVQWMPQGLTDCGRRLSSISAQVTNAAHFLASCDGVAWQRIGHWRLLCDCVAYTAVA